MYHTKYVYLPFQLVYSTAMYREQMISLKDPVHCNWVPKEATVGRNGLFILQSSHSKSLKDYLASDSIKWQVPFYLCYQHTKK